jgi:hypothetical protein
LLWCCLGFESLSVEQDPAPPHDERRLREGSGQVERRPSREKTLVLVTGCGLWARFSAREFVTQQLHYGPPLGSIKHHLYFSPIVLGANKNLAVFFLRKQKSLEHLPKNTHKKYF